jgi:DNA primase
MTSQAANRIDGATIAEAKARNLAAIVARHLPLKRRGTLFVGSCPFHHDPGPSFTVYPDNHFFCFGCGEHGDAIDFLVKFKRIDFQHAIAELATGSVYRGSTAFLEGERHRAAQYAADGFRAIDPDTRKRIRLARGIWNAAQPIKGTLGERYFRGRGITRRIPDAFRFAPALRCSQARRDFPAVVAAIHDSVGLVVAVQRIWLDPETAGKAPVEHPKKSIGAMGDGALRLGATPDEVMGLAEGPETGLSCLELFSVPVWVACGMSRFKSVRLPPRVRTLYLFADGGEAAMDAALTAAEHFENEGREVVIQPPPGGADDWNTHHRGRHAAP